MIVCRDGVLSDAPVDFLFFFLWGESVNGRGESLRSLFGSVLGNCLEEDYRVGESYWKKF